MSAGFTIADLAEFSVARQIAAARQAEILAGPHGAALIHGMFMQERSTIIECFSPRFINPSLLEIYWHLKHRYFQIVQAGTPLRVYPYSGDVEVNCRHLELVLQRIGD